MAFIHSPKIVTDGLVLALDAGNVKSYVSGSTTWFDKSGFSNNGTLTNGPTFSSANLGSIVFDGVDDYVQTLTGSIANNSSFTLSCWFKITTLNSTYRPLVDGGNLGSGTAGYTLSIDNTNKLFIAANAGYVSVTTTLNTNTWYYVVGVASAGSPYNLSVYVNGVLGTVSASATTNVLTNNFSYVRVGENCSNGLRFPGNIAATQIYNRALTQAEITQNFNSLRGRFGI
jgi:hypothetical protein